MHAAPRAWESAQQPLPSYCAFTSSWADNWIGNVGAQALLGALHDNETLNDLSLDGALPPLRTFGDWVSLQPSAMPIYYRCSILYNYMCYSFTVNVFLAIADCNQYFVMGSRCLLEPGWQLFANAGWPSMNVKSPWLFGKWKQSLAHQQICSKTADTI